MSKISAAALLLLANCGSREPGITLDAGDRDAAATADSAIEAPSCANRLPAAERVDAAAVPELTISGDPGSPRGIFDPSIVYPGGAAGGAMSYSSVDGGFVGTRIAVSDDAGATWAYVADANVPTAATIDEPGCAGGMCDAAIINEVSSLVFDPTDPDPARAWKLFTARYPLIAGPTPLRYELGHIALYTAPAPAGPWAGPTNAIGWNSTSSFSSAGAALNVDVSYPDALGDCEVLTEPGAIALPGAIDVALGCAAVVDGEVTIRIELFRSTDHAASFVHVRTLVEAGDAPCLGASADRVNAAALVVDDGQEYLLATPETAGNVYQGCVALAIDDPADPAIRRDADGFPVAVRRLAASDDSFSGACAYAEGATALGVVVGIAHIEQTPAFRLYRTGEALAP